MKKTIAVLAISIAALSMSGCAGTSITEDFKETNEMIARSNVDRLIAFKDGMIGCGDNAACQGMLGMAFAANMGQQSYFKPETTSDLLRAFLPYASLGLQAFDMFYSGTNGAGSSGAFLVEGDNNTFMGIGNNTEASGGSTVNIPFSSVNTFSWSADNNQDASHDNEYVPTDTGVVGETTDTTSTDPVTVTDE